MFNGGTYRHYSEVQKQRFWQLVIEQGYSVYKAAQSTGISMQTIYTSKRKWFRQDVQELKGTYDKPKKHDRKPLFSEEHKCYLRVGSLGPDCCLRFLVG